MRNPSSSASASTAMAASGGRGGGGSRQTTPCCSKVGLKRGPWTTEEDELLANYIKREGEGRWRTLPKRAGLLRCGKSCRLRWMNYLHPSVKRGHIAPDEEDLILRLHRLLGNRWSLIAGRIPGRTDNEIKNYWNTHLSKKLINQGIDPRTHKPLNSNPSMDSNNNNNNQASSSRANHINVNFPVPLEKENAGSQIVANNGDMYHEATITKLNQLNDHGATENEGINVQINTNNVSGMGWRSSEGLSDEDEDGLNYCNDDVFSTFLNSLINEDGFNSPPQQLQLQQTSSSGALLPSAQMFPFGVGWDAPFMSSESAFNQNDLEIFGNHVEKQS